MRSALFASTFAAISLAALFPAAADVNRSTTIAPGKQVRLAVVTGLKRDCSVGAVGSIRVITTPKTGQIAVKGGKAKTPASFRCPNVETPIQALFYQAKAGFTGTDEVSYETRTSEGQTEIYNIKINVTDKPATGAKDNIVDL